MMLSCVQRGQPATLAGRETFSLLTAPVRRTVCPTLHRSPTLPLTKLMSGIPGRYGAIACAALVVDGGIYRHDFVAQAVVDGIVRVGLDTNVPVLSVSLTPHSYQETDFHNAAFAEHFVQKGCEAANAALGIVKTRAAIKAL